MKLANLLAFWGALIAVGTLESIRSAPFSGDVLTIQLMAAITGAAIGWASGWTLHVLSLLVQILEKKAAL